MDRGAWWATAQRVTKSWTWLSMLALTWTDLSSVRRAESRVSWSSWKLLYHFPQWSLIPFLLLYNFLYKYERSYCGILNLPPWPPSPARLCATPSVLLPDPEPQILPSHVTINTSSLSQNTFIIPHCPQTSQEPIPLVSTRRKKAVISISLHFYLPYL